MVDTMNVQALKDIKVRFTAEKIAEKKKTRKKSRNPDLRIVDIDEAEAYVELLEERQLLGEVIGILTQRKDAITELFKSEMLEREIDEFDYDGKKAVSITDFTQRTTALDDLKENDPTTYSLYVRETKTKKINFSKINVGD